MDVTNFIKANSNQLNGDDLLSGPITVQIEAVKRGNKEQPVKIEISGGHQAWMPCKTCLRILVGAHDTPESDKWVGTWVRLYRDPDVKFGGVEVGGIRIEAMSCVKSPTTITLTETRGRKAQWKIKPLSPPSSKAPTKADHLARIRHLLTQIDDPTYEGKLVEKFGSLESMSEAAAAKCAERLEDLVKGGEKERATTTDDSDSAPGGETTESGGGASEPEVAVAIHARAKDFPEGDRANVIEALSQWYVESGEQPDAAIALIPRAKVDPAKGTVRF